MLDFNFQNVEVTEFGVGREDSHDSQFVSVRVDAGVQAALLEMAQTTWKEMQNSPEGPVQYQPSEKHGSTEYLLVPKDNGLDKGIRELHEANNLTIDGNALNEPNEIFCYFARFIDNQNRRLTGLRRASQFKGVLKNRLIHFANDSLKIVEDKLFKLDGDFDLLIDSEYTHIWRPSAFESISGAKQAILDAVPNNVDSIKRDVDFIDFESIQAYASKHLRAARYLASIRTQQLAGISCDALKRQCRTTGVKIEEADGLLRVADVHVMGFLEVLDRRRYQVELVPGTPEQFKAASRSKIDG